MPEQIMTLGRKNKRFALRGKKPLFTDFREIPFQCQFVEGARNGAAPKIQVSVLQVGKGVPEQISIELIPPERPGLTVIGQPLAYRMFQSPSRMPRRLASASETGGAPTVMFSMNTGFNRVDFGLGPAGDLIIVDPLPPLPSREFFTQPLTPGVDPQGRWRMRLHNLSQNPAEFSVEVRYPETVQTLETTSVPFQLLNRAFAEVLLLMSPRVRINNGRALIQFDPEFRKLTGIKDREISVSDMLKDINLETFNVCAGRDAESGGPVILMGIDFEDRGDELDLPLGLNIDFSDLSIQIAFSLSFSPPLTDFFATAMVRDNGENFPLSLDVRANVYTNPNLETMWARFLLELMSRPFSEIVEELRLSIEGSLNGLLQEGISAYIQDALVHLVEKDHAIQTVRCDSNGLIVEHHALPDPDGRPVLTPGGGRDELIVEHHAPHERLREGEIDHIVFLMMENRSFDHMLGYLSLKGRRVIGLTGNEENSLPEGNPAYVVHHLTRTSGIPTPGHHFDDVKEQIALGQMTGFATNYSKRGAATDPGLVMSYYTEVELPMYEFFANYFAVCDAWFCSHPGPTWPNRFCATTGEAPETDNFDITDDRIGYFKGTSIFDWLTAFGVDWAYVEGNVGFIRMFDRYRLDTQHVIPYQDDFRAAGCNPIEDTFVNRVRRGDLPAVTFIDPRFISVPPSWDANDDLPPADVCHGQALMKRVYELLSTETTWQKTLLVITYDEHGGFFDHVPPPGTPAAANSSPLPRITPNGADHLGVRVPAFLVSPWVDAASVISTQLEHTSIIRTILERFVSTDHANRGVLGARAAQANSLLTLPMLRPQPRTDVPAAPDLDDCTSSGRARRGPVARDDFGTAMRLIGVPPKRRRNLVD